MVDRDRAEGVLLGLSCGDALGRPVEGWSAERIDREYGTLESFAGDGTHGKPPGTVTDDTQLATRLARSLLAYEGFDRDDFASRLVDWYDRRPFGIGGTTTDALRRIAEGAPPLEAAEAAREAKPPGEKATNGSVMRCAPLAIAYADDLEALQRASRDSSRVTHADPRCVHGCAALTLTIAAALEGSERPLAAALVTLPEDAPDELVDRLEPVPDRVTSESLVPANDAVETLRTALFHALTASDLETAIVGAVGEGGDADTIGAVAGAVAGARFGANALPERWLSTVEGRAERAELADRLVDLEPSTEHESVREPR
ncbi:ADP-ribosylglycohydrolase family protein [Natrinema salsiterrestre]|uniref:ADP-ribosylglycohydrolase family protein n=1 Tax=Natrinema salsiterrestre TaxID=2950540 RepID=A0A9Q4L4Q6_9EURY|nr:ADP-ribosylglycohydrolase family protein [Natrinema salsiterrestre]MDF9745910.1 ADP-ribosylglycohydrolase family protein [Natrinema salsiterrestre]